MARYARLFLNRDVSDVSKDGGTSWPLTIFPDHFVVFQVRLEAQDSQNVPRLGPSGTERSLEGFETVVSQDLGPRVDREQ